MKNALATLTTLANHNQIGISLWTKFRTFLFLGVVFRNDLMDKE